VQQEGAEAEEEVTGPIEPSIAPVTAPNNAPDISPTEETASTTAKDETFLEVLNADEAPLEEISNTEVYTTRLKLAEAYLEMGDEAGARDMLNEVVAEGDDAQKALAKSIIQRIDDALDDSKDT
jgi:pilus assembly protein FimV